MTQHRYPIKSLILDYLRAGVGLSLTAGPLIITDIFTITAYILLFLALLFTVFAIRTVLRQITTVALTSSGVESTGLFRAKLDWCRLERVRLRYYTTRRDRRNGWMQLSLMGPRTRQIKLDSSLEGFEDIALAAAREARNRGIVLDSTTTDNLYALDAPIGTLERR